MNMFLFVLITGIFLQLSPEQNIEFARHLENEGDYYRAITEYKRAFYSLPDSANCLFLKDEVAYSIVKLSEKLRDYGTAKFFLNRVYNKNTKEFRFNSGLFYFLKGEYKKTRELWNYSDTLIAWTYLKEAKFDSASGVFGRINVPRRYPVISALLSAVLPGLGKVYTKRFYDGFYSFVLNAGSLYLVYDAYSHERKPEIYLYSGMFLFFYTGNIYGSWLSAKRFNTYHLKLAITEKEISLGLWQYLP